MTRKPHAISLATLGLVAGTLSLIACAEGAAVDNGSFTKELALSPQVEAPKPGEQTEVRLAASIDEQLAVWIDGASIVAARVRDGELLDRSPMVIHRGNGATVPDGAAGLAVASNGRDFLVVWTERELQSGDLDLRFARVSADGVVLDPGGRALAETNAAEHAPVVTWTPFGWITSFRSDRNVAWAKIALTGSIEAVQVLARSAMGDAAPAMLAAPDGVLVGFGFEGKIRLANVNVTSGAAAFRDGTSTFGGELTGIALGGPVVAWTERIGAQGFTFAASLYDWVSNGQPTTIGDRGDRAPSILWRQSEGLIALETSRGVELVPFHHPISDGSAIPNVVVFGESRAYAGRAPSLAELGGERLLGFVRHDGSGVGSDTYLARVTAEGVLLDGSERLLARGTAVQQKPAIVMGKYGSLVAWTDSLDAQRAGMNVRWAQLSIFGVVQKTGTLGTAVDDFAPAVATDGQKYLIAWGDGDGAARIALIDEIGNLVRTTRLPFGAKHMAAAWNGSVYLVATPALSIARFDRAGVALDPQMIPLPTVNPAGDDIALAPAGDAFLAAYHWYNGHDLVSAVRIATNGAITNVPMTIGFGHSPSIAWDGQRHTIVWLNEGAIHAARVLPSGIWTETPKNLGIAATGVALAPMSSGGVLLSYTDGAFRLATLQSGLLTPMGKLADAASAPAVATFADRLGVAYEVPSVDATTAIRARLLLP